MAQEDGDGEVKDEGGLHKAWRTLKVWVTSHCEIYIGQWCGALPCILELARLLLPPWYILPTWPPVLPGQLLLPGRLLILCGSVKQEQCVLPSVRELGVSMTAASMGNKRGVLCICFNVAKLKSTLKKGCMVPQERDDSFLVKTERGRR